MIFFHLPATSSHLHPLQVENCDINSRLVVDEDDNDKLSLERVNQSSNRIWQMVIFNRWKYSSLKLEIALAIPASNDEK